MDVFSLVRACLRRWWVFVPLLAIAAAVTVLQGRDIKPTYSESAQMIVVPPSATPITNPNGTLAAVNPLGATSTVQAVLVVQMNSARVAQTVAEVAGGSFAVGAEKSAGILTVTASAPTARRTRATLAAAIAQVPTELAALQSTFGTSRVLYYQSHLLNTDAGPSAIYAHRGRNIVLIALAGVIVSVIVAQLVDFALLRRRAGGRRRRNAGTVDPTPALDTAPLSDV